MTLSMFVISLFRRHVNNEHGSAYLTRTDVAQAIRNSRGVELVDRSWQGSLNQASDQIRRLKEAGMIVDAPGNTFRIASPDEPPEESPGDFRDPVPEARGRCGDVLDLGPDPGV